MRSLLLSLIFGLSSMSAFADPKPTVLEKAPTAIEPIASFQKMFKNAAELTLADIELERSYSCVVYTIERAASTDSTTDAKTVVTTELLNDTINLLPREDGPLMNAGKKARYLGFTKNGPGFVGVLPISPYYLYLKKLAPGSFIGELVINTESGSLDSDEVLQDWPDAVSKTYIRDSRALKAQGYQICFKNN